LEKTFEPFITKSRHHTRISDVSDQWRTQKISEGWANFRRNRVTSQINFRGSAEGTTILGGPGICLRENFANLHLKIRIFVHSGSKLEYNAFTTLISR